MSEEGKLGKLMAIFLKLVVLVFGLGTAFLVLSVVLSSAFTRFMAIGLILSGGVLLMAYSMLDDIMELRDALQNNDLKSYLICGMMHILC